MGQTLSNEQGNSVTWKGEWESSYYPLVSGEIYLCLPVDLTSMIGKSTNIIGYVKYSKLSIYKPGQIDTINFSITVDKNKIEKKKLEVKSTGLGKQKIVYYCNTNSSKANEITILEGKYTSQSPYDYGKFKAKRVKS